MTTKTPGPPLFRVLLGLGAIYIIWGTTYLAIRYAVETLPPFLMTTVRFGIAGGLLYGWARWRGAPRPETPLWRPAFVTGTLMMVCGMGVVSWAEETVPSGLAAVLVTTVPIWIVLIDWLRPGGTRPGLTTAIGLAIGFGGVVLLIAPWETGADSIDLVRAAAIVLSAVCWAAGSLYTRSAAHPDSQLLASGMQMLAGTAILLAVGTILGEWGDVEIARMSGRSVLSMLYLSLLGSVVAITTYRWLLSVIPASRVATYAYVNPVVAVFLGWLLAAEPMNARMLAGTAVIIGAVALVNVGASKSGPTKTREPSRTPPQSPAHAADRVGR